MEQIIVLGTGNASTLNCYNTCFLLQHNEEYMLVDTGGGNGILKQLQKAQIDINQIHDVFLTHNHFDHVLGIFWILRVVCRGMSNGAYIGSLNVYCDKEISRLVKEFCIQSLPEDYAKFIDDKVIFHNIINEQEKNIIGYQFTVLDTFSIEGMQYGFQVKLDNGKVLTFLGDVPCSKKRYKDIKNTDWVLHESFCLYKERDVFKPYPKNHTTVKDVCETMELLNVKNLVLWHTEEANLDRRKKLYKKEASTYFSGNVYVPDDLDYIEL